MLNLLIPVLMLQCTDLRGLSGTLNTSLSEDTTCWNLRCVGRLQLVYSRNFSGSYRVVRSGSPYVHIASNLFYLYAEYGTTEFEAYWDVELSAHMDECADGDCDSAVQFSWGCNTAAPAIEDSIEDTTERTDSGNANADVFRIRERKSGLWDLPGPLFLTLILTNTKNLAISAN